MIFRSNIQRYGALLGAATLLLVGCGQQATPSVVRDANGEPRVVFKAGTHRRHQKLALVASTDPRLPGVNATTWLFYNDGLGEESGPSGKRQFTWNYDEARQTMKIRFADENRDRVYEYDYDSTDRFVMQEGNHESAWETVVEPVQ